MVRSHLGTMATWQQCHTRANRHQEAWTTSPPLPCGSPRGPLPTIPGIARGRNRPHGRAADWPARHPPTRPIGRRRATRKARWGPPPQQRCDSGPAAGAAHAVCCASAGHGRRRSGPSAARCRQASSPPPPTVPRHGGSGVPPRGLPQAGPPTQAKAALTRGCCPRAGVARTAVALLPDGGGPLAGVQLGGG